MAEHRCECLLPQETVLAANLDSIKRGLNKFIEDSQWLLVRMIASEAVKLLNGDFRKGEGCCAQMLLVGLA